MILNEFQSIVNEYFDVVSDAPTRKCVVALEDSEQQQLLSALSSALYDKIVSNVDKIDFGSIPRSRGDITKVDGYDNTIECIRIMRSLIIEYKQDPTVVDNVMGAIENIKANKTLFMKAYDADIEFPIVLYNLMVMAIEQAVTFLITVCIQYVKDPDSKDINVAIDKVAYHNAQLNLVYQQIVSFNNAVKSREFDKAMQGILKDGQKVREAVLAHEEFDGRPRNVIAPGGEIETNLNAKKIIIKVSNGDDDEDEDFAPTNACPVQHPVDPEEDCPECDGTPFADPAACEAPADECDGAPCADPVEQPKDVPDDDMVPVQEEEPEGEDDYGYEISGEEVPEETPEEVPATEPEVAPEEPEKVIVVQVKEPEQNDIVPPIANPQTALNDGCKPVKEIGIATVAGIVATGLAITFAGYKLIIHVLIPSMRNLTFFFLHSKVKFADSLETQAQFIEANAYKVRNGSGFVDGLDDKKRTKIVQKQLKIADKLKKLSNKLMIDYKTAAKKTEESVKAEVGKMKIEDIKDELPADVYSKSVLF